MSRKLIAPADRTGSSTEAHSDHKSAETLLLDKAEQLLHAQEVKKALETIAHVHVPSQRATNLKAVCLLRLGRGKDVVEMLRPLVIADGLHLRPDVPTNLKINFATGLLLENNVHGCVQMLNELQDEQHPGVVQLRQAIKHWRSQLPILQKLNWMMGGEPSKPVEFNFPVGSLE